MNTKTFFIQFSDLDILKQNDMVRKVKDDLYEEAQKEGMEFLKKSWYNPQPKTWQEAYVRTYSIDYILWADYEARKTEKGEDWESLVDMYLEEKAIEKCSNSMSHLAVSVEV